MYSISLRVYASFTDHEVGRWLEHVVLAELLQGEVEHLHTDIDTGQGNRERRGEERGPAHHPLHLGVETDFEGALLVANVLLAFAQGRQTQQLRGVCAPHREGG